MSKDLTTGVIQTKNKPIIFSVKENSFEFCFMTDSIYSFAGKNQPVNIPTTDGFICGKTHENYNIAIYLGNSPFEIFGTGTLNTSAYIKSNSNTFGENIMEYEAIQFVGGTLNNVFHINGIDIDYENGDTVIRYNDDSISYTVVTSENSMELDVRSSVNEHRGVQGNSISNNNAILTLKFDKPQPLVKLFDHYNRIKDLLSFMTFRDNVGFEKIHLLKTHPDVHHLLTSADVFIRGETELTAKDYYRNISFSDLGASLPNLLKLFYDTEDKKQTLSLGFLPANDRDINIMTNTKIRSICSALECELSFIKDIKEDKKPELEALVKDVRYTVKEFRKNYTGLSNDTYNFIFSNINIWSFPLAEKLCDLYHKYEAEMVILNNSRIVITDDLIRAFVKYRNDITHGKHRILEIGIAVTAHHMCGLVYCCILERIGIRSEDIKALCQEKILS